MGIIRAVFKFIITATYLAVGLLFVFAAIGSQGLVRAIFLIISLPVLVIGGMHGLDMLKAVGIFTEDEDKKEKIKIKQPTPNKGGIFDSDKRELEDGEFVIKGVKGKVARDISDPPTPPESIRSKDVIDTGAELALMPDSSEEFFNRPVNQILDHRASTIQREAKISRGVSAKSAALLVGVGLLLAGIVNRKEAKRYEKKFREWRKSAKFAVQPVELEAKYLEEPLFRRITNSGQSAFMREDTPTELKPNIFDALWDLEPDSNVTIDEKKN